MQGAVTAGKAKKKGKAGQETKASAAPSKRKKAIVQSSSSEDEEQEEESSSEDDAERFEIERVLHGRRDAETKQEEFLVKFKGGTYKTHLCKSAVG